MQTIAPAAQPPEFVIWIDWIACLYHHVPRSFDKRTVD
ncbi:hypothetical protein CGLO_17831 [Colletotrichum gloeosporioides Cg-14]|uniref:Uncharacterized protein n=1 Tax=Colletotrichum gloeosporioides (strain Cg-14) TaxID=1237896 RepID=T0L5H6_COLGC|nr:hypothetical protein CGLO_17831 [Colletotrichum gloeosporioides Cg-14]